MYDLSWLNPTPHAIAVYASQPLSPVATQHSLPSGRYSLLGPDFHRLDRTSFVLAHLFDHIVCKRKHIIWNFDAERLCSLHIEDQLKLCLLHDWQVRGLGTLEGAAGINADLTIRVSQARRLTSLVSGLNARRRIGSRTCQPARSAGPR